MKLLLTLALCLGAVPTLAAPVKVAPPVIDAGAMTLLDKVAKSYATLDSLAMIVTRSSPDAAPKEDDVLKNEVAFRRPNFIRTRTIRSKYEILAVANSERSVLFGNRKALIIPEPLRTEAAIEIAAQNSGVGEAVYVDQKLLAALLQGQNPVVAQCELNLRMR